MLLAGITGDDLTVVFTAVGGLGAAAGGFGAWRAASIAKKTSDAAADEAVKARAAEATKLEAEREAAKPHVSIEFVGAQGARIWFRTRAQPMAVDQRGIAPPGHPHPWLLMSKAKYDLPGRHGDVQPYLNPYDTARWLVSPGSYAQEFPDATELCAWVKANGVEYWSEPQPIP